MVVTRFTRFLPPSSLCAVFFLGLLSALSALSQVAVTTYHNDNARTGQNLQETILTLDKVNSTKFGKVFSYSVDGQVYAQPLYVPGLRINGATHNVVFVATEHDSVFAFDADGASTQPLWQRSFIDPPNGITTVPNTSALGIKPEIGITSTPVIDLPSSTLYVEATTREQGNNTFRLHALDLITGAEKFGGPVLVKPTVNGTGFGNVNGVITIDPGCLQRASLALVNGVVYLGFASCSHGWLAGYDATTLAPAATWSTTADGKGGGIWMGGGAPASDSAGHIYIMSGNDADNTTTNYVDSFVKLDGSLTPLDFFSPSNRATLVANDADLGSGAPMLLPDNSSAHPHELIGAGKDGRIFILDRDNMGGFSTAGDNVVQTVQSGLAQYDNFHDTPAYWNGYIYYHAANDKVRQFQWSNGLLSTAAPITSGTIYGIHGATPVISANGTSNGILWDLQVDQAKTGGPTILHAYDATNVAHELYNSAQAGDRDTAGPAVKFTVPTVANGKVYVGGGSLVTVYGLLSASLPTATVTPGSLSFSNQIVATSSAPQPVVLLNTGSQPLGITNITASGDFTQTNNCGATLAASVSCTIEVVFHPSAAGSRSGSVVVASNAQSSPQTITLSGTGTSVPPADFALAVSAGSSATATIAAGQAAAFNLSVQASGFSGAVNLSCAGAPPSATCTVNPAVVTLTGSNSQNVTVSVGTVPRTTSALRSSQIPWTPVFAFLPFFGLVISLSDKRQRRKRGTLLLALLVGSIAWVGCGGKAAPPATNGTPSGTYAVTVSGAAANGTSHTVGLTVVVQ